jgi:hypothetical protein
MIDPVHNSFDDNLLKMPKNLNSNDRFKPTYGLMSPNNQIGIEFEK